MRNGRALALANPSCPGLIQSRLFWSRWICCTARAVWTSEKCATRHKTTKKWSRLNGATVLTSYWSAYITSMSTPVKTEGERLTAEAESIRQHLAFESQRLQSLTNAIAALIAVDDDNPSPPSSPSAEQLPWTPRAKKVVALAQKHAREAGLTYMDMGHLLSGIGRVMSLDNKA